MKVAIVEDNEGALISLKRDLADLFPQFKLVAEVSTVDAAIKTLTKIEVDLVFMDVNLPDGTCFDVLKRIDYSKFKIIFASAYDKYAINAFRFSAVDYLLKPIKVEEFKEAVAKFLQEKREDYSKLEALLYNSAELSKPKKIALNNSDGTYVLDISDLVYIEANGNYCNVFIRNKEKPLLISKTLKHFEEMLKISGFIRSHHAFIVNTEAIHKYVNKDGGYLILKDRKESIPISQRKKNEIVEFINSFS